MNAWSDDGAELPTAGINEISFDEGAMIRAIMAKVRGDGSGSEIDTGAKDGIADVAQVSDVGAGHQNGIFELNGISDMAIVTDVSGASKIAVWADLTVRADDDFPFDVNAW